MDPGTFLAELKGHSDRVSCLLQVGVEVWSTSTAGTILVHDRRGILLREMKIPSRGLTLDYASCLVQTAPHEVWCGLSSGGICVYRDGAIAEESDDGHQGPVTCIAYSERTKLVWTGG